MNPETQITVSISEADKNFYRVSYIWQTAMEVL